MLRTAPKMELSSVASYPQDRFALFDTDMEKINFTFPEDVVTEEEFLDFFEDPEVSARKRKLEEAEIEAAEKSALAKALKLDFKMDFKSGKNNGFLAGPPMQFLKTKVVSPFDSANVAEVRPNVSSVQSKKKGRKQHMWSHEDIISLVYVWSQVQLEFLEGEHKWNRITSLYQAEHKWASKSTIQSYFKSKIKGVYNCKKIYNYIVENKSYPDEKTNWLYLMPKQFRDK